MQNPFAPQPYPYPAGFNPYAAFTPAAIPPPGTPGMPPTAPGAVPGAAPDASAAAAAPGTPGLP